MISWFRKRREHAKRLAELKKQEAEYINNFDLLKKSYEGQAEQIKDASKRLSEENERVVRELERLKLTEERLLETQREAEKKIRVVEAGADPHQLFAIAMKLAMEFAWDINKDNTKELVKRLNNEFTSQEQARYDKAIQEFKTSFDYTNNIMKPSSIMKLKHNLEEDLRVAERRNDEQAVEVIKNKLSLMKVLGIIK
ncbi:MAG: hypothetical protein KKA68_20950 [Gammaproteobacteria bacterium]|nr:hypothetical protein [Gammaproteobacteria bacterium]